MQTTEGTKMKIVQKLGGSHVFQHLLGQIKKHGLKIRAERIHYGKTCSVFFFQHIPAKMKKHERTRITFFKHLGKHGVAAFFLSKFILSGCKT
jgi:hypothetical protein